MIFTFNAAKAEDSAPSRIDSITKSARDMMPAMPAIPSLSLPSMPDLSLPDFSDSTGRLMTEFNAFTQEVGDALPIREQMGHEVTTFKVTWGLPPKARLRLKSNGSTNIENVNAIAAKATTSGVLVSALITSAATAKRIQNTMKLGAAYLDVDFAIPPRVNMKFVNVKTNNKEDIPRDSEDLEIVCKYWSRGHAALGRWSPILRVSFRRALEAACGCGKGDDTSADLGYWNRRSVAARAARADTNRPCI